MKSHAPTSAEREAQEAETAYVIYSHERGITGAAYMALRDAFMKGHIAGRAAMQTTELVDLAYDDNAEWTRKLERELAAPDRAPSTAPAGKLTKGEVSAIRRLALDLETSGRITSLSEGREKADAMTRNRELQCALDDVLRILTEPASAPSTDSAADARVQRLLKAATTYAMNWCQDEAEPADDHMDMVCTPAQHADATELFAAIAAMQPKAEKKGNV